MTFPSICFNWTPPLTYVRLTDDPIANLGGVVIPAMVLGFFFQGRTRRMVHAMMLEVLRQDYIRTARSKGLQELAAVLRPAAKNAMIPVVTLLSLEVPFLLGGTVIIEDIFDLPGLGRYAPGGPPAPRLRRRPVPGPSSSGHRHVPQLHRRRRLWAGLDPPIPFR